VHEQKSNGHSSSSSSSSSMNGHHKAMNGRRPNATTSTPMMSRTSRVNKCFHGEYLMRIFNIFRESDG